MDGKRMRELRGMAGLRMDEVSAELKVHRNTVYGWETDRHPISLVVEEAFTRLVGDVERVARIKMGRKRRKVSGRLERWERSQVEGRRE